MAILAQPTLAQTTTPPPASDEIVVSAPVGDQQRIDRHVYVVKDNAEAQAESGLQLMAHVPSLTVNADDHVQLMGDPNVKVLIDGHSVIDGSRALKALPAGQIARIEVMTNPSAAFSAEGTSGVINVITRRRDTPGIAGAATVTRNDYGGVEAKLAPSVTAGPWTASIALTLAETPFHNDVTQTRTATDPADAFAMTRDNSYTGADFFAHAEIGYRPSKTRTWTLTYDHQDSIADGFSDQTALSRGSDLFPLTRLLREDIGYWNDSGSLAYAWSGKRQGETLSASATLSHHRLTIDDHTDEDFGDGGQTSLTQHEEVTTAQEYKLDYAHPFAKSDILSLGGSVRISEKSQLDGLAAAGDHITSLPYGPDRIGGRWITSAAYATLQFPLGKWTVLPGLRLEDRSADAPDLGSDGRRNDLFLFPSLHVDRALGKRLAFSTSYSRRIEWPSLQQLDPTLHYYDPVNAGSGNPALRPQLTDAIEAGLTFKPGKQTIGLKLYDRETAHAWLTDATLLPNGVNLTSTANIGTLRKLGGELTLQGPIWHGWRYMMNIDLLQRRTALFAGSGTEAQFTYSGNAQLEYRDKADGKPGANHLELAVDYTGPTDSFQERNSAYTTGALTWTHAFTPRLSSVVKLNDLLGSDGSTNRIIGSDYRQVTRRLDGGRRVTASIVCRLGKVK